MKPLYILLGIAGLLLLLACLNLATIALARAHNRTAELSVARHWVQAVGV